MIDYFQKRRLEAENLLNKSILAQNEMLRKAHEKTIELEKKMELKRLEFERMQAIYAYRLKQLRLE